MTAGDGLDADELIIRLRRRMRLVFALVLLSSAAFGFSSPVAYAVEGGYPTYNGNTFRDLVRYAFEVLPGLGSTAEPTSITGNAPIDDRIWNLAFDRGYNVQRQATISELVWVEGHQMQPGTAAAWSALKAAAGQAGHAIALTSAYRSVADQKTLFLSKLYGTSTPAISTRLARSAPPGASRHHTGYAIDIKQVGGSNGGFGLTLAFAWIAADNYENAKRFGFVPSYPPNATDNGPDPEPWDYVFVGDDVLFHDGPFSDVLPNNLFVTEIAWLSGQNITRGCNSDGSHFCPYSTVDRGAMAAFINRAFSPPGYASDYFVDDDSSIFEGDINAVAAVGIVKGCDPPANTRYCPLLNIDRGALAALLRRALGLAESTTDHFTDDDSSIFEGDINALADAGITTGCGAGKYCPTRSVTRGEFAAMMYRSRNLLP